MEQGSPGVVLYSRLILYPLRTRCQFIWNLLKRVHLTSCLSLFFSWFNCVVGSYDLPFPFILYRISYQHISAWGVPVLCRQLQCTGTAQRFIAFLFFKFFDRKYSVFWSTVPVKLSDGSSIPSVFYGIFLSGRSFWLATSSLVSAASSHLPCIGITWLIKNVFQFCFSRLHWYI